MCIFLRAVCVQFHVCAIVTLFLLFLETLKELNLNKPDWLLLSNDITMRPSIPLLQTHVCACRFFFFYSQFRPLKLNDKQSVFCWLEENYTQLNKWQKEWSNFGFFVFSCVRLQRPKTIRKLSVHAFCINIKLER